MGMISINNALGVGEITKGRFGVLEETGVVDGRLVLSAFCVGFSLLVFVCSMNRPVFAHVLQCSPVLLLPFFRADRPSEVIHAHDGLYMHIRIVLFYQFRQLGEKQTVAGIQEKHSLEPVRIGIQYLAYIFEEHVGIWGQFLPLKVHQNIPFFDDSAHQHEPLERSQQVGDGVEVVPLVVLLGVEPIGPDDDNWRVIVVPPVGVEVAVLENLPAVLVEAADDLVLVPLVVEFHPLGDVGEVEVARVVEAQQQLVGVVDVRRLFLQVLLQLLDGLPLEWLVDRTREDATDVPAVDALVDVARWVGGNVRGSLIRAALLGGVR
jgi:hypothetical protein